MSKIFIILFSIIVTTSFLNANWINTYKVKSYKLENSILVIELNSPVNACNIAEPSPYISYRAYSGQDMHTYFNAHINATQAAIAIINSAMLSGKTIGVNLICPEYLSEYPNSKNNLSFTGIHIFN